jgi:hypothetical protein
MEPGASRARSDDRHTRPSSQVLVDTRTHGARRLPRRHSPARTLTLRLDFFAWSKIAPHGCSRSFFGCNFYAGGQLRCAFRARPHWPHQQQSISGLVLEYIVAIGVTRVQFPADALDNTIMDQDSLAFSPRRSDAKAITTVVGPEPTHVGKFKTH